MLISFFIREAVRSIPLDKVFVNQSFQLSIRVSTEISVSTGKVTDIFPKKNFVRRKIENFDSNPPPPPPP